MTRQQSSRRNRTLLAVLAAAGPSAGALAGALVAGTSPTAGASSIPRSHTLELSFLQDPGQPPDPAVYYAGQGLLLQDNIYEGLVQYAANNPAHAIVPDLATSWSVSDHNQTYTFHLRHGVLFHDGTKLTSAAIWPSFQRDVAVGGGPAYMAAVVKSVTTPNPFTAVVHLTAPNSIFLDYLASPYGPRIYSPTGLAEHAGKNHDQTYLATHDLGTGPYELTKAQPGIDYQLKAFAGYWGKKPYYTTVNLPVIDNLDTEEIQLQDGHLAAILHDLTAQAVSSYRKSRTFQVYSLPTLESEYAYVNQTSWLSSAADRRALLEAIDVKQIQREAFAGRGTIATQIYPRNLLPASLAVQKDQYDPAALRRIVAKLPASERTFTIGYDSGSSDGQLIASLLTIQLDQVGLTVRSIGYPTGTIYGWAPPGNDKGAPDLLVDYVWPDAYDAYQWAHINFTSTGGVNYLHCAVPGVNGQLAKALATNDLSLYGKVGEEAVQSGCYLNLVNQNDVFVAQRWLKGLPQGHVVAAPYSVRLAALYPG